MDGTDANTGKPLGGIAHLRQSVRDILTTPIGTRVMRRDYGSRLFELTDKPINAQTLLLMYAETADALAKWEPRIAVKQVTADTTEPGTVSLSVTSLYLPDGQEVTVAGIVVR